MYIKRLVVFIKLYNLEDCDLLGLSRQPAKIHVRYMLNSLKLRAYLSGIWLCQAQTPVTHAEL